MPHNVDLNGVRGDRFLAVIPLSVPRTGSTPERPMTADEATALKNNYTSIKMQVRLNPASSGTPLMELTSAAGELSIEPAYLIGDGSSSIAAFVIKAAPSKTDWAVSFQKPAYWDAEFTDADGPYTWLAGKFIMAQDVTR